MNLSWKVFLSMATVILVALGVATLLIDWGAGRATQGYLRAAQARRLERLARQAEALYRSGSSWETVQRWLDEESRPSPPGEGPRRGPEEPTGGSRQGERGGSPWLVLRLVDPATGVPLVGEGAPVDPARLSQGLPIRDQEGRVVALLVAVDAGLGPMEEALLAQVRRAVLLAAVAAGLVALVVGGLLVLNVLRPLRQLQAGVHRIAQGDRSVRVPIRGQDEIGQLAQAFNRMAESLERQEALRQRMVADIAHELRTPLSVIQGSLQAILEGVYPLEHGEIRNIYQETRLLSRLIADLHDLAQAEAGRLPLARQRLPVAQVLEQMAVAFQPLARAREIVLEVDPPPAPLSVDADPDRLQQILHNLLGNALHHVPPGGRVRLAARALDGWKPGETVPADAALEGLVPQVFHDELLGQVRKAMEGRSAHLLFLVEDDGPGMAPEVAAHVFDRFYRADTSRSHAQETGLIAGAGLGLAISKALVELHGGAIGVVSRPGHGAVFWFLLPLAPPDEPAQTP